MKFRAVLSCVVALVMVFQLVGFASAKTVAANPLKSIAVTDTDVVQFIHTRNSL